MQMLKCLCCLPLKNSVITVGVHHPLSSAVYLKSSLSILNLAVLGDVYLKISNN